MLRLAQAKRAKALYGHGASFVMGSAMSAPFKNAMFDSATTAFVLRNVSDLPLMFTEALRVLKPGGKFVSIDMFPPAASWFARLYSIYFYRLMPRIGGFLSHDHQAYRYLSDSVRQFHSPEQVSEFLHAAGFRQVSLQKFLAGAVCMHVAVKPGAAC
jgi:demethylmenaquinone methyltransferase/2-methoxy-6-polyprenyl-1,4-benzoquinol methylase